MRCRRCGKTIGVSNRNHNKDKQECARCHYLGQICAYPGVKNNPDLAPNSKYALGKKWCKHCGEWREWDGAFCPVCRYRLRTRPERKVFREKVKPMVRY